MTAGMGGTVTTIGLMALAGPSDAFWMIPLLMFFTGCSFRLRDCPRAQDRQTWARGSRAAETGHASTLQNTMRQAGAGGRRGPARQPCLAATGAGAGRPGRLPTLAFIAAGLP